MYPVWMRRVWQNRRWFERRILQMQKSKFSGEQIAFALRQAEVGTPVAEVCRKMGISETPYYRWKQLYGGPVFIRALAAPIPTLPNALWAGVHLPGA
jgi:hypothetical protein